MIRGRSRRARRSKDIVPVASLRRRLATIRGIVRRAPRVAVVLVVTMLALDSIAGAVMSLAVKWLIDGATTGRMTFVVVAAVVGGVAAGAGPVAGRILTEVQIHLADRVGYQIDRDSLDLTAQMPGLEHLERPAFLDQVSIVRGGGGQLVRAVFSIASSASLVVRLALGLWLLASVHPLLLLLTFFAVPSAVVVGPSRRRIDEAAVAVAEGRRASSQIHRMFLDPAAAMELRVFSAAEDLDRRADALWRDMARTSVRGALASAAVSSFGWVTLALGYVSALLFVAYQATRGRATAGDVMLVSQLALQLRGNIVQSAGIARDTSAAMRTIDRYIWLQDAAVEQQAELGGRRDVLAPSAIKRGIQLEHVSFAYPGVDEPVLDDVTVDLPAGSTVAIVGENGAGKTSLVKLLCGFYRPTSGRILVDGVDLSTIDADSWRAALSAGFQDFLHLEAAVRQSVGVGDVAGMHDDDVVRDALAKADAAAMTTQWPDDLATHLGKTYAEGIELSGGQWQRLAVARAMMRQAPLLLILDEPTSALDPAAEHALYQRYAGAAQRAASVGGMTILISHRFSSVRMADFIVVLSRGRVVESGVHDELLARGGVYAEMFRTQASAYT